MWLSLLVDAAEVTIMLPGTNGRPVRLSLHKCQSEPDAERWTDQGCRWTSASPVLVTQTVGHASHLEITWQAAQAYFPSFTLHSLHTRTDKHLSAPLFSQAGALDRFKSSQCWGPEYAGPMPAKNKRTQFSANSAESWLFLAVDTQNECNYAISVCFKH